MEKNQIECVVTSDRASECAEFSTIPDDEGSEEVGIAHSKISDERKNQLGANLAEYSLLAILILVVAAAAVHNVGKEVSSLWSHNASEIQNAN